MKVKLLRDVYNSLGELFAAEGEIVDCQPASTPHTVILTKKEMPGYPLMTFADDVEPVEMQP